MARGCATILLPCTLLWGCRVAPSSVQAPSAGHRPWTHRTPPIARSAGVRLPPAPLVEAGTALPIAPRKQHADAPQAGWCGETAIQEALLYFGVWAPQRSIHAAGKPSHADLYAHEIPTALDAFEVHYELYAARVRGFGPYERWVRRAIDAGHPVLAGVKIFPTAHPDWGLDHFVLAVGHGDAGLLVNTTWGTRHWVGESDREGLSLKNAFFAIRLKGRRVGAGRRPARLEVLSEDDKRVKLLVRCPGATAASRIEIVAADRTARFTCTEAR